MENGAFFFQIKKGFFAGFLQKKGKKKRGPFSSLGFFTKRGGAPQPSPPKPKKKKTKNLKGFELFQKFKKQKKKKKGQFLISWGGF
ncbi:hypothetical protein HYI43_11290 [Staphylococcus taiwanensis]|nr:hypothetical protein HYI43_11290 [Staphylococcus taiwanensis]